MVRPKPEDIEDQLKEDELDTDGSEYPVSGTDDAADSEEMVKVVFGNEPEENKPFISGEEVNKDEDAIRDKEIDDYKDDEDEDLENPPAGGEKNEATTEDVADDNKYETYGEDDDLDETSEE